MNLIPEAIERGARALAEALNGGSWETHYTEDQKALWRDRVRFCGDAGELADEARRRDEAEYVRSVERDRALTAATALANRHAEEAEARTIAERARADGLQETLAALLLTLAR